MRIDEVKVYHISKPLARSLANASYIIERIEHVLVEVAAGDKIGIGLVYTFHREQAQALKVMLEGYGRQLIGKDGTLIQKHLKETKTACNLMGPTGMPLLAWAAVDIALWDLLAQQAGMPLYQVLGAFRTSMPVYASGGFLGPLSELLEEADAFRRAGYRHYKMKLGCPDVRDDLKRIEALRQLMGDDVEIMVDVNQGWSVKKVIEIAPRLLELGVSYLEEPVHAQDYMGQAEIRRRVPLTVVAGETLSSVTEQFELMRNGCVDMLNLDVQKCGGVSDFMQVAAVANAFRIPVTSHVFTEISGHLLAAAPTATMVEYLPDWWDGVFLEKPDIRDGYLYLRDDPGIGYHFDHDFIREYKV